MNDTDRLLILFCVVVMTFGFVCVRGCQAVYNPDSIRADAEARIQIYQHDQKLKQCK